MSTNPSCAEIRIMQASVVAFQSGSPHLLKAIAAYTCAYWDDLDPDWRKDLAATLGIFPGDYTYSREAAEKYLSRELVEAPSYDPLAEHCSARFH